MSIRRECVLVVDGDPLICRGISRLARHAGIPVETADSGQRARAVIDKGAPTGVLLALSLPDESGLGFLRWLHTHHPGVACTVHCIESVIGLPPGIAVLSKLAPPDDLIATLRALWRPSPGAGNG